MKAAAAHSGIVVGDIPSEPMKLAMAVVATGPIILPFAAGDDFDLIYSADWAFYNAHCPLSRASGKSRRKRSTPTRL
jgi:hypothetical protein